MDLNCSPFSVYISDDTKLVPKLSSWSHNIINKQSLAVKTPLNYLFDNCKKMADTILPVPMKVID